MKKRAAILRQLDRANTQTWKDIRRLERLLDAGKITAKEADAENRQIGKALDAQTKMLRRAWRTP